MRVRFLIEGGEPTSGNDDLVDEAGLEVYIYLYIFPFVEFKRGYGHERPWCLVDCVCFAILQFSLNFLSHHVPSLVSFSLSTALVCVGRKQHHSVYTPTTHFPFNLQPARSRYGRNSNGWDLFNVL